VPADPAINVPVKPDPRGGIYINPNLSDEIEQATIVDAYPGSPPTRKRVSSHLYDFEEGFGPGELIEITGGYHGKEVFVHKSGEAKGATSFDGAMKHVRTGVNIFLSDHDALADRMTETKRENFQSEKAMINKGERNIYVTVAKPRADEEIDREALRKEIANLKDKLDRGEWEELTKSPQRWNILRKVKK